MPNPNKYGPPPFRVAVLHGGPGAAGEMAPVARELATEQGILEPLQTADSVTGQVAELKSVLEAHAELPAILIGFSWGAWLSYLLTAQHPILVKKLILVASGPFEEKWAKDVEKTRLSRMHMHEKMEFQQILDTLTTAPTLQSEAVLARLGALVTRIDAFDPLPEEPETIRLQMEVFRKVWPQAAELRRSGKLLALGKNIHCPVVALHGDYDPHPAAGVKQPLSRNLAHFRFILLTHCGHKPWIERQARELFFDLLKQEVYPGSGE